MAEHGAMDVASSSAESESLPGSGKRQSDDIAHLESSGQAPSAAGRRAKRQRTAALDSPAASPGALPLAGGGDACRACLSTQVAATDRLLQCSSCDLVVHASCYSMRPPASDETLWSCDVCASGTEASEAQECVYCKQPADAFIRRVSTAHWPPMYRDSENDSTWGHMQCALWDPFLSTPPATAVISTVEGDNTSSSPPQDIDTIASPPAQAPPAQQRPVSFNATHQARLLLPVPPCCFCASCDGVRVQCRHLQCGKFFHVRCASAPGSGHVSLEHSPFRQSHVYCDRHRHARPKITALTTKLMAKAISSALPKEVAAKIAAVVRNLKSYATVDAVLSELSAILVDLCKRGLQSSKADPPRYMMKHLQVLQLVLDHVPQLQTVYDATSLSKNESDLVNDAELLLTLHKAFHPQRFVRKFAGSLSQHHTCDHCHEPFQERQHVFYCTSPDQPHALHWKCTKRKSSSKAATSAAAKTKKIKSVALVQHGHWKDVKLPKGLPSISDGVSCGVCRAEVDARGLISGRKEATKLDFERPTSAFMFGGSLANEQDARTAAAAGLRTSRVTASSARKAAAAAVRTVAAPPTKRLSQTLEMESGGAGGDGLVVLGPPKMERISVRRTTRWLACLAQVIRLVMAARTQEKEAEEEAVAKGTEMVTKEGDEESTVTEPESEQPPGSSTASATEETAPVDAMAVEAQDQRGPVKQEAATAPVSTLPKPALAYLEEAKAVVRPFDAYALQTMETAQRMLEARSGPGLSLLHALIQEYTRFMYIKHTRAVAKATTEKRKRQEQEAHEERERERKRIDREAEVALKKQMQAMRKKPRQS